MTTSDHPSPHPYALVQEPGCWRLTFDSAQTTVPDRIVLLYLACLLPHPRVQLSAARLAAKIQTRRRLRIGLAGLPHPDGASLLPDAASIVEELPDSLADSRMFRNLRRDLAALQATLDDDHASEPEKAEARRDLDQLLKLQRQYLGRFRDTADKAANTLRRNLSRFVDFLRASPRGQAMPHPVLLRFADHLEQYLLLPSRLYAGPRARHARADLAGGLIYNPPPGIVWFVSPSILP
jgi:hypothetical protein